MIKNSLLIVALLVTSIYAAPKVYRLKLAMTWGSTLEPFVSAPNELARLVKEMSNGRLIIKIDDANRHKSALAILDLVKSGQYDLGHTASYYYKGKDINY